MTVVLVVALGALLVLIGCDHEDRIARLEKETQEVKTAQSDKNRVADYDLQAKCAKDARAWFNENWAGSRDKDTVLLDFRDHYNKKENKCFVLVEYHYNSNLAGPRGTSWTNIMSLWDVYENSRYGDLSENHYTYFKPTITSNDEVITCMVLGRKCTTIAEFNNLTGKYMND
jgi:hypothetical protein